MDSPQRESDRLFFSANCVIRGHMCLILSLPLQSLSPSLTLEAAPLITEEGQCPRTIHIPHTRAVLMAHTQPPQPSCPSPTTPPTHPPAPHTPAATLLQEPPTHQAPQRRGRISVLMASWSGLTRSEATGYVFLGNPPPPPHIHLDNHHLIDFFSLSPSASPKTRPRSIPRHAARDRVFPHPILRAPSWIFSWTIRRLEIIHIEERVAHGNRHSARA